MREKEISASHSASEPLCCVSFCCPLCTMVSSEVNFQTVEEWEENGNGEEFLQTDHKTFSVYFLLSILESADNLSQVLMLATGFPPRAPHQRELSLPFPCHFLPSLNRASKMRKGSRMGKQLLHPGLPENEWSVPAACLFLSTIFCQSTE